MADPTVSLIRNNRVFRTYWLGQSVSSLGTEISTFALPLVSALTLDAGARGVSAVATSALLPFLLFSLLAGHLLTGLDERRVMIVASLVQAGVLAMVPVAWLTGYLSVPLLMGVAFVSGTAEVAFSLGAFAFVPVVVGKDDVAAANRAVQGSQTIAQAGGPGLAGMVVQIVGAPMTLALDALSCLANAAGLLLSRREPLAGQEGATRSRTPESPWSGMRLLFGNAPLRSLTVHSTLYNLAAPIVSINLVVWAVTVQDVPVGAFGVALAAAGAGGLIGTVFANRLADRLGFGRAYAASLVLFCVMPYLLVAWPLEGILLALVIGGVMVVSGVGLGIANVFAVTLRQVAIPPERLARAGGAYRQVTYGAIPIGTILAGALGEAYGSRTAIAAGVTLLVVSTATMLGGPVWTLRRAVDACEQESAARPAIPARDVGVGAA